MLFFALSPIDSAQENSTLLLKIKELQSGLKLRYTLALPPLYSPEKSYPLVVALHYGGKVTPFYSKDFVTAFVEPALKNLEAIIVAPDCPFSGWTNPISESALLELILLLMGEYKINPDRLVITGYSLGGAGTWYLATRHPHLFSAAIPISAPVEEAAAGVLEHVPVHIIHSEQDKIYPIQDVKRVYQELKDSGAEIELMIVTHAEHDQLGKFIIPLKATIPWIKKMWEYR